MPASDEVAPTTRKFYFSSPRMDVKPGAVVAAYAKLGALPLAPSEMIT